MYWVRVKCLLSKWLYIFSLTSSHKELVQLLLNSSYPTGETFTTVLKCHKNPFLLSHNSHFIPSHSLILRVCIHYTVHLYFTCISEECHVVGVDDSVLGIVEPISAVIPPQRDLRLWPAVCQLSPTWSQGENLTYIHSVAPPSHASPTHPLDVVSLTLFVCDLFVRHKQWSIYSGTSDNGHSEEWTTSLQWTTCSPLRVYCSYYIPLKKGQPLNNGQMLIPNVPIIQRFHCIVSTTLLYYVQNIT